VLFAIEDQNQRLTDFLLAQGFQGYLIEPSRMKLGCPRLDGHSDW
jgi:hypothetical protein